MEIIIIGLAIALALQQVQLMLMKRTIKIITGLLEDQTFTISCNYFDWLQYMRRNYHIVKDMDNKPRLTHFYLSEQDELKFIKFKTWLDKEYLRRGIKPVSTQPPDPFDPSSN